MPTTTTQPSGADHHRAAAACLDQIAQAHAAEQAAKDHTTQLVRRAMDARPRLVTAEQVAEALGVTRRTVYKLLDRAS